MKTSLLKKYLEQINENDNLRVILNEEKITINFLKLDSFDNLNLIQNKTYKS